MNIETILSWMNKIEEVKKQQQIKNPKYYNKFALKRDTERLYRYIQNVSSSKWINKVPELVYWEVLYDKIHSSNDLDELSKLFSEMSLIVFDWKEQILEYKNTKNLNKLD